VNQTFAGLRDRPAGTPWPHRLFSRWIFLMGGGGIRGDRDEIAFNVTLGTGVKVWYFDLLAIGILEW
jgi:hypothetical protein